ncbi:hypothetical protein NDU88_002748 [Pleurodeles waltl]|uniref:Polyprenal reductase n=2 Tax=Pleurodeles waltl TaxID=8319 RepID=A0AAV7WTA0_PLEWA|nr:hypothetical protein NDU88_002748 [Pleurodeles waltl]
MPGIATKPNFLDCLWLTLAVAFLLAHLLHRSVSDAYFPRALHCFFEDVIRYGKTKSGWEGQRFAWMRLCDLPKRWFSHFYVVSVLWNGFLIMVLIHTLFFGHNIPAWLMVLVRRLSGVSQDQGMGGELSAFLVLMLLWLHSLRRLAECILVSVFSDGVIHLLQYCFGLLYYILLGITVLCQVPFHGKSVSSEDVLQQTRWHHILGVLIYLWASVHQHRCHKILANLRKNKSGEVINMGHNVPSGDWFDRVSCPHYFAELLIYIAMVVIFGIRNFTWCMVVMYVLCNQALAAVLCHEFYLRKFDKYPKQRKAFIPFVF